LTTAVKAGRAERSRREFIRAKITLLMAIDVRKKEEKKMYCFQCEQTAKGTGCNTVGVCGKSPEAADLMDLLIHATKGLSMFAHRARKLGAQDRELDMFIVEALFSTVTNVNFDPDRLAGLVRKAAALRDKAKKLYEDAAKQAGKSPEKLSGPAAFAPAGDLAGLLKQAEEVGILARRACRSWRSSG
jgi:hydroxylamine reductase